MFLIWLTFFGTQIFNTDAILDKIAKKYTHIQTMRGKFIQRFSEKDSQKSQEMGGKFYIKFPHFVRIEFNLPFEQLFIQRKDTVWVYYPKLKQAFKGLTHSTQNPFSILPLLENHKENFSSSGKLEKGKYKIKLIPKTQDFFFKEISLIANNSLIVEKVTGWDNFGNQYDFIFQNVKINIPLSSELFKFSPPKGTKIIDQTKNY